MKRICAFIFVWSIIAVACTDTRSNCPTVIKDPQVVNSLESDLVTPDSVISVLDWKLTDRYIVIYTSQADGVLQLWSLPELKYHGSYIRKGRGPGELIAANWGQTVERNAVILYDIPAGKLTRYLVRNDSLETECVLDIVGHRTQDKSLFKPYVDILQMNDSFYAMRASDRQKDELSMVNLRHGNVVSYAEELLQRDPEKDQYLEYDYLLATDGRHLVKAYMESDRIEIFELLGTDLLPRCVITGPENSVSSGYNDIICMGDRFVCLFASDGSGEGNILEVYGYDGSQLDRIALSHPLTHILYDEKNKIFYGYNACSEKNNFYLFRYPK